MELLLPEKSKTGNSGGENFDRKSGSSWCAQDLRGTAGDKKQRQPCNNLEQSRHTVFLARESCPEKG